MPSTNWSRPALHNPSGFGIYIHWPFCQSKCPYCDFNSHPTASIDQDRWRRALTAELDWYAPQAAGQQVTSIFFGGGTPSLMDPATVEAIIDAIVDNWDISRGIEVTLEANPTSVEAQRFQAYRTAGINRLSLGVQALDDPSLRFLGRRHSVDEALKALETARQTFDRTSFDLIYARPGQTLPQWQAELERALALGSDHMSLYQLSIEEGTAFAPRAQAGEFALPLEDLQADMFTLTQERMAQAGLPAYEVSNHARPGSECHHNLTYWLGGDYLGVGPGAHGRLWTLATKGHSAPQRWLELAETQGHGAEDLTHLAPHERATEMLMTGLRLTQGIHRRIFKIVSGLDLDEVIDRNALAELVQEGLMFSDSQHVRVTPAGFLLLNALTQRLLP